MHGFEVQATSPEAAIVFQTGRIHVEFQSANENTRTETDRSFTVKVSLKGTSIFLKESKNHLQSREGDSPKLPQVWAGLETNITAQSYAHEDANIPKPEVKDNESKTSLDSIWVWIAGTRITLQPAAIDKALLIWVDYMKVYRSLSEQRKQFME